MAVIFCRWWRIKYIGPPVSSQSDAFDQDFCKHQEVMLISDNNNDDKKYDKKELWVGDLAVSIDIIANINMLVSVRHSMHSFDS